MDNNYTVLARKYRSQDFKSLIGQDVLVKTTLRALRTHIFLQVFAVQEKPVRRVFWPRH